MMIPPTSKKECEEWNGHAGPHTAQIIVDVASRVFRNVWPGDQAAIDAAHFEHVMSLDPALR